MRVAQRAHRLHRGVRRDVAGIALEAEFAGLPALAEAGAQRCRVGFGAIGLEEAEAAFEDGVGAFEALFGEARREDARLGRAARMQPLDHGAVVRFCEREHAAAQRARDAERLAQPVALEAQQPSRHDGGAKRPGEPRCVKSERLAAVARSGADAKHDFASGNDGGKHFGAARVQFLAEGKRNRD